MSLGGTVADAIIAEINANDWAVPNVNAVRSNASIEEDLKDFDCLHVDVFPISRKSRKESRSSLDNTVTVHVFVRYKFGQTDQDPLDGELIDERIDELDGLLDAIHEHFAPTDQDEDNTGRLPAFLEAVWSDESQVHYSLWPMLQKNLYAGYLALVYEISAVP